MCYSDIRFVTEDFRQRERLKDIARMYDKIGLSRCLKTFYTLS